MKEIEERYDVFVRASPPGTRLMFTAWTEEFPGVVASGEKPDRSAVALGETISTLLVENGITTLPPPIDHDDRAFGHSRAFGDGYGRRMAVVRLQLPD